MSKLIKEPRVFRRAREIAARKEQRKEEKSLALYSKSRFTINSLEERILLSADPISSTMIDYLNEGENSVVYVQTDGDGQKVEFSTKAFADENNLINFANLDAGMLTLSSLMVEDGTTLGGSGSIALDLVNYGTVSPGYSPGILNTTTYENTSGSTLEMELAGNDNSDTLNPEYDQINATGAVSLSGTLDIIILDDFVPTIGEEYTIITGSSITGAFTEITGLYGFHSDYYFELEQTSTSLKLIAKELIAGDDFNIITDTLGSNNDLGKLLNATYFATPPSQLVLNDINLQMGDFVASGDFAFYNNSAQNRLEIIGGDVTLLMGAGDFSVGVKEATFGMYIIGDEIAMEATGSVVLEGLDFGLPTADSVYVKLNETAIDFTDAVINIGTSSYTFSDMSVGLKEVSISNLEVNLSEFVSLSGDFGFYQNGADVVAVGLSASASINAGDYGVGVSNASVVLVMGEDGVVMHADGTLDTSLGNQIELSAQNVSVEFNQTNSNFAEIITVGTLDYDLEINAGVTNINITGGVLNVSDFALLEGNFSFSRDTQTVTLSDSTTANVALLTLGVLDTTAFVGLNGNSQDDRLGFELVDTDFALVLLSEIDTTRQWMALNAGALSAAFVGSAEIVMSAENLFVEINRAANDGTLIDFKLQPLEVAVGAGSIIFKTDGLEGEVIRVSGDVSLSLGGFFSFSGFVSFNKSTTNITLTNNDAVEVSLLSIGTKGVDAFAGLNGDTQDALGVELSGVDFAFALMSSVSDSTKQWMSLQANAGSAAFVGLDDVTLAGKNIQVQINENLSGDTTYVDYSQTTLEIDMGAEESFSFDMEDKFLSLRGDLELGLYNFFNASGSFALEKSSKTVTLSDNNEADVDMLLLGASDLSVFAGLNYSLEDEVGLVLGGVNFALALMSDKTQQNRKWSALQATAENGGFVGIDNFSLFGENLMVNINTAAEDGTVVDFVLDNLTIQTSETSSVTLDMDASVGEYLRVSGYLDINMFNFFSVDGSFAIEKTTTTLSLDTQESVEVDLLTIGATSVNAFVGVNGGSADAVGIEAKDTDFALVIASDMTAQSTSQWTTLSATVGSAGFVGVDGLTLNASNLNVEINRTNETGETARYIDYTTTALEVKTGSNAEDFITLSIDGKEKELTQISGEMSINLFNFFSTSGNFALKKSTMTDIALKDADKNASTIAEAEVLTLGGAGIDAFIGMNGNSDDALGLRATDVNFALALINNKANKEQFTSLQATVGGVAFEGIDELTMSASNLTLNINQATNGNVVDYASMIENDNAFEVVVGSGQSVTLDMNGDYHELLQAAGYLEVNLFNFVALEGNFGFEKSTRDVTLNSGEEISVDYMSIGGMNISAFAGLNYNEADAVGLSLGDMDFGLALMSDKKDATRKFTSLQADAASAAFIGVDGLTISASDLKVYLNQGIKVDEIPEQIITENTTLKLIIAKDTIGQITLSKDALNETFSVDAATTDAELIGQLQSSFATLTATDTANVEVSGSRDAGFTVEFIGALAGTNVEGFSISTAAATISASVSEIKASQVGRNEVTTLVIETPRIITAPVYTEVFALSSSSTGINEVQSITFKDPYNAGTYALSNGTTTLSNIKFVGSQTLTNETNIQAALVSLYGGTTADYKVKFDTKSKNGHTYYITFQGTKAHSDLAQLTATPNADMGAIVTATKTEGSSSVGSSQHFSIDTQATGTYTLSLNYNNQTYTTTALDFAADATTIQTALNAALSTIAGATAEVVVCTAGIDNAFDVSFGGTLEGVALSLLQITSNPNATLPSGTFTIGYDTADSQTVTYAAD
ncbi:LEPR-XLL domain-containing protein, partial [bacterium]|nr:LEPR-XLL domain-containing protein [bacterium]